MVALLGVADRAPRQKGPPEEGGTAAVLLQHGEVHMEGHRSRVQPEAAPDRLQLVRAAEGEDTLPLPLRQPVEVQPEGFFEQGGQTLGEGAALGDNAGLPPVEGVAVQQHPVGLRLGTAPSVQPGAAQLLFDSSRKGHAYPSKMYRRSPRKMRTARSR